MLFGRFFRDSVRLSLLAGFVVDVDGWEMSAIGSVKGRRLPLDLHPCPCFRLLKCWPSDWRGETFCSGFEPFLC